MPPAAILDVDGTLVDTNYQHVIAWSRALRSHGVICPLWRIHRHIGMGGDNLVRAVAGDEVETKLGDDVRAAEKENYAELIDEVEPMDGARDLLEFLKRRGHKIVLASSAKQEELDHYLDMLEARGIADAWTSSADVETTKPAPDLVEAAMKKVNADGAVMVGDSTFDCEAAGRAGVPTIGVLTGGFSESELREAGAVAVFESLVGLKSNLDETPLKVSN
ncbi:MAG TPA: HAD family hydrolase [Actinomycetota bacterium]|nr:HAD family hydrolase [Actinomycetota bacterium]